MFVCKQFRVADSLCAMKVTTDSLLFGSWLNVDGDTTILDVGSGSGVLTLCALQKTPDASRVVAIDVVASAVQQTQQNIADSRWSHRAIALQQDFFQYQPDQAFTHIICNPPYFQSAKTKAGVHGMNDERRTARQQLQFTPERFFSTAARQLTADGQVSVIYPFSLTEQCITIAAKNGLNLSRIQSVKSTVKHQPYLSLMTYTKQQAILNDEPQLVIKTLNQHYTAEFKALCRDFYLHF